MLDIELIETPFPMPESKHRIQLAIHAGNCAVNWLECASFEEYPLELRYSWRDRGERWLDAMGLILAGSIDEPCSTDKSVILDELLEEIETLWHA